MCERISVPKGDGLGSIDVEFNRDASLRLTEVIIVNNDPAGIEAQGMKVLCYDDGDIVGGVTLREGVDIVGHAEMRG